MLLPHVWCQHCPLHLRGELMAQSGAQLLQGFPRHTPSPAFLSSPVSPRTSPHPSVTKGLGAREQSMGLLGVLPRTAAVQKREQYLVVEEGAPGRDPVARGIAHQAGIQETKSSNLFCVAAICSMSGSEHLGAPWGHQRGWVTSCPSPQSVHVYGSGTNWGWETSGDPTLNPGSGAMWVSGLGSGEACFDCHWC